MKLSQKILTLFLGFGLLVFSGSAFAENRFAEKVGFSPAIFSYFSFLEYYPFPLPMLFAAFEKASEETSRITSYFSSQAGDSKPFQKDLFEKYIPEERTELSIWMLGETAQVYQKELEALQRGTPQISLNLRSFSETSTYFEELQKAFSRNEEPDIFLANAPVIESFKLGPKISSAPPEILRTEEISEYFHPIAQDFTDGGAVWAAPLYGTFPLMISNRALLRDERIFVAGRPGSTWPELFRNLQKFREFGDTKILPVALGQPNFSPFTFDLFLLLLEQADIGSFSEKGARDALSFLLSYAEPFASRLRGNELEQFLQGKIAVIFGDEETVLELKKTLGNIIKIPNGHLQEDDLELHLLPKLRKEVPRSIGDIWGFAVSKRSSAPELSWALAASLAEESDARAHFFRTGKTPLLKRISNGIFSESAQIAVSGKKWRKLDFESFFRENVLAHFPEKKQDIAPSPEETLQKFTQFFSSHAE